MALFNPALLTPSSETNLYHGGFVQHGNLSVGMESDWKLVLLFVQADRTCSCEEEQATSVISAKVQEVDRALQLLHSQLKRTIVSVAVWDGEYYDSYYDSMCPCYQTKPEVRIHRAVLNQFLQESLDNLLVKKGWFGDREDFAVVLQDTPLVTDLTTEADGRVLSEVKAAQQADRWMLEILTSLLQPQVGQPSIEDNDMVTRVPCPSEDRPFLRTEGNSPSTRHTSASPFLKPFFGTEMPCTDLGPSPSPPTSVHALRPADIKVVAAVGDSLTAGNGIASSPINIVDVLRQYRGLSWSIGGDENLTTITTLPNILRNFNPELIGYSVGVGKQDTPAAFLNQAVAGAKCKDLPKQVRALVNRMKNDSRINFESDWKVITLFIGGNDACDHCKNSLLYSVDNYLRHVRESLDYLHEQVPRALVNLVEVLHITPLRQMHEDPSLKCPTWLVKMLCSCVISPKSGSKALNKLEEIIRGYQRSINDLVESGRYDSHANFTVVIQPFIRDIDFPTLPNRKPDRTYFSADCFHLSQKAQTSMARSLWNNMLEPLGSKTSVQDFSPDLVLKCPSKASPYVRTYQNSNYTYKGPGPTPAPITNWGSDFACVDISPSASVPISVHKLRPGDIKVVAALGDSSTTATGAKAKSLFQLNTEYRGVSWSIGGDAMLETVTTLPNILKKFNPALQGFSEGRVERKKGFNMAISGAKTSDIPAQVKALIKAMMENKKVDYNNDWKLVTIFVGGNDLCNYCIDQDNLSAKNYSQNLKISLDMLYNQIGQADLTFFSVDCFHISEKAHAQMAIALWNNMLEPVGQKQDYNNFTYDRTKVHCPSKARPFLFTKLNSLSSPPVPPTTVTPATATTTAGGPDSVSTCPSSLPVWVPVVVAFASVLIGLVISWLFVSFQQRLKKDNMEVEKKKTGF
ncbi:hypothetical protein NHX12_026375 [Muraenolepis orangiensis]|uniref:Phospholipase B1, membrane-associated n=1 Tax=Muraenolepis orangiensis TaxID=630683 RepID=A0A9Q0EM57_9TELE|nr:hypothetical protein NHX12_026375 [Muraenolepis orangiensis]